MSIYDQIIIKDIEDIYSDSFGFAVQHNVDGDDMLAIVHTASISPRSTLIDLAAFGADCVIIVRAEDFKAHVMPTPGCIFFLDDIEYRVQNASRVGGHLIKISLNKVES